MKTKAYHAPQSTCRFRRWLAGHFWRFVDRMLQRFGLQYFDD